MTNLDRPILRQTGTLEPSHRRKPLVVRLTSRTIQIREKGTRRWYTVPYDEIFRMGCRIRAQELREEKAARRRARSAT